MNIFSISDIPQTDMETEVPSKGYMYPLRGPILLGVTGYASHGEEP